jgi:hypothetical protein
MTLVKAAAVAVASGVSLSVPLNDLNYIPNESEPSVRIILSFKIKIRFFFKSKRIFQVHY